LDIEVDVVEIPDYLLERSREARARFQGGDGGSAEPSSAVVESTASSEETNAILQEASAVAEQQIGDKFPSVPSLELPTQEYQQTTTSTSTFE